MPEIPPFKLNAAVNYEYDDSLALRAEVVVSDKWSDYDEDNGEQELDAYAVLNLRGTKQFNKNKPFEKVFLIQILITIWEFNFDYCLNFFLSSEIHLTLLQGVSFLNRGAIEIGKIDMLIPE